MSTILASRLLIGSLIILFVGMSGCAAFAADSPTTSSPVSTGVATTQPAPTAFAPASTADAPQFGAPQKLMDLPPAIGPIGQSYRISPDGEWVCYVEPTPKFASDSPQAGMLVARSINSEQRMTLVNGASVESFTWMPDSKAVLVVVASEDNQPRDILVKAIGPEPARSLVKATQDSFGFNEIAVSPDKTRVALKVAYDASPAPVAKIGIEVIALDGSERHQIVEPDFFIMNLAWSPDSQQVVYFKGKGGTPPQDGESYVVDANISAQHQPRLLHPRMRLVEWSPDGQKALWASEPTNPDGTASLFVTNWPNSDSAQLIVENASAFGAAFIGNQWICYAEQGAIYLTPIEGTRASQRLTPEEEQAERPQWIPQAQWIPEQGLLYQASHGSQTTMHLLPIK